MEVVHLYTVVYAATFLYGILLRFTFKGILALLIGIGLSLFSAYFWGDIVFANVVAFIAAGVAMYLFVSKDY
jgi:hypothetical protein